MLLVMEDETPYRASGWVIGLGVALCLVPVVGAIYGGTLMHRGDERGKAIFGLALFVLVAGLVASTVAR
jgi:hypothetical protein